MTERAELFVDSRCELGEGPIWHAGLQRLFWFDILGKMLFSANAGGTVVDRFSFDDVASAAGIVDDATLVVVTGKGFLRLDLATGQTTPLAPLEPQLPGNRPNDGRVHPAGGMWIGTMSRKGGDEPGVGSVYQFREGKLEKLFGNITIPNAQCFSADGSRAWFADTQTNEVKTCAVDPVSGKPVGDWTLFTKSDAGGPDGAVIDSEGYFWNARFGAGRVVRHAPDGRVDRIIEVPTPQVTCPAFGGKDLRTLYITTAGEGYTAEQRAADPHAGSVFAIDVDVPGLPEARLRL